MTHDPLLQWRDEFPILQKSTYLISNSLGAMPRGVYDSLREYADTWATLGVRAWGAKWWHLRSEVGDKIAPLMGAPAGTIVVQENASIANSIIFSGLDFSDTRRSRAVISDMDFPSDIYTLRRMLPLLDIHMVKSRDGITLPIDELLDAIDDHTRIVSLSHVLFRSAFIMPAKAIVEKAHRVGAQVLLNGYHSVGIIPVDVTALNIDFYIGGTLKWMCGGPGGVFMYVRSDLIKMLDPKITGWFAHQKPFTFDTGEIVLREDIHRFSNGTPGIASLYAIQPGIEILAKVGVDAIRAKSVRQTSLIIELAQQAGYTVNSPLDSADRAGTITLKPDHAYEISRELIARNIIVDYRENAGIRVAPHFYNSDDEIYLTMNTIAEILADGSWQKHTQRAFVT
jgi:kynureninase